LSKNGYKYKDFLKELKDEIRVAKLLDSVKKSIIVTPEDVKNEFKKVKARHILISIPPAEEGQTSEELKKLARKKIADIYNQLVKGADFGELAKKYSEDPGSAANGGELGFFGTGQMIQEFEKQAFSLKEGSYSKPFETLYGFHIVQVEKITGGTVPLDIDEKEEMKKITDRRSREALQNLDKQANENALVEIYLPTLLAYDYKYKGELDKALGQYQLLASQSPQSPIPQIFTAEIYQLKKDYTSAHNEFQRALLKEKMFPATKTPFVHFYLGKLYAAQKQNALAAKEYKTAEALVKDNLIFLQQLKKAYQDIGYADQSAKLDLKVKAIEAGWKMAQEKAQGSDDFTLEEKNK
jgi:transcriptional regulator of met regulon